MTRSLDEILQSTSDNLFPAELGEAKVDITSTDCDGDTPLHVLLWRGDTEGAIILIDSGAPIDAIGDMGETPLHVAIAMGNHLIIDALISAGAKSNIISEFGKTARQFAIDKGINLENNPLL